MIYSMTGYGKAECILPNKKITIEIKSLNSKQLDINTRMPGVYKEKEIEIRKMISNSIQRGKVEFNLYAENLGEESNTIINAPIVKNYIQQLQEIKTDESLVESDLLEIAMRLPDAMKNQIEKFDDNTWITIKATIQEAIAQLEEFRVQEGEALRIDLLSHIQNIETLKGELHQYESARIDKVKSRIYDALNELKNNIQIDNNRFEQEMIFYIEKLDINEEKVRLENHCQYFKKTIEEGKSIGKKLNFISQEIGREINTVGSKANHTEIQKIVVQMKDELEKIKEQSLNIL